VTHTFKKSLSKEQELIKEKKHLPALKSLNKLLREKYGCYLDHETYVDYSSDMVKQKQGIDAGCEMVCIKNGDRNFITWDYKFRFKPFSDFLAETVSVDYNNTPGWAIDPNKENKLIININMVTQQVIVVSRKELRDAIISDKFSNIGEQESPNKGYNTKFIAIPVTTLQQHCPKTLIFTYD
tara:strand:+ start:112 stop:657 length:546 start_codon:yes stop_codon:yes gene_type:complete